jgi:predicted MPP superfamily phosphohydrolase
MRGIPSSFLLIFFILIFTVELISYFGLHLIFENHSKKRRIILSIIYFVISLLSAGLLIYAFANPEVIRQAKNYTFFYAIVAIGIVNLVPKFIFAIATIFSFVLRWLTSKNYQIIFLNGLLLICLGFIPVIISGIYIGKNHIRIDKHELHFDNWPNQLDGFTVVQISDIHLGSFAGDTSLISKMVKNVNRLNPDLLLFTGDLVNNFSAEITGYDPFLQQLSARFGKFAIQGNHDYGDYSSWTDSVEKTNNLEQIRQGMTKTGFRLLLNESEKVSAKDTSFTVVGVENWGHPPFPQYADLTSALKNAHQHSFKILLTHDPAHWQSVIVPETDIELTLSGHTHGAQFGLKIAGIEFSPMYFIQKHWGGLYESEHQKLYVNRGLGTIGFPGRIDMRPEITVLTLSSTKSR